MLQACLNGARAAGEHPALPLTPEQLAADAAAVADAGVRSVHVHPRDGDGAESLEPEAIGAAVAAIRAAAPGLEISVSTGLWITGGDHAARLAAIAGWTRRPDCASVNVSEPGWEEVVAALAARRVRTEAGLATPDDARAFAAAGAGDGRRCVRVLVEPEQDEPAAAVANAAAIDAALDAGGSWLARLHHGEGVATWAVLAAAAARGHDVRIGLEDTLVLPDGREATGNPELVTVLAAGAGL